MNRLSARALGGICIVSALLGAATLALTAVNGRAAPAATQAAVANEPSIWEIDPLESDPLYREQDAEFKAAAKKYHFKGTVVGTTSVDIPTQISMIKQAIAQKANAILFCDIDPKTYNSTIVAAKKAGVVMITTGCVDKLSTYSIGTDNVAYAKRSADLIAKTKGPDAQVVLFSTNLTVPNQALQYHTFVSYAKKKYPNMKLVAEEEDSADPGKAAADIRSVIEGYPNVNTFWMIEDASGPIIGKALQQAGKKPGDIFVLGIDALPGTISQVQQGWIPMLLHQCFFSSMPFASQLAVAKLQGHGLKQQSFSIPVQPVTKATLPYKGCPASYFPALH